MKEKRLPVRTFGLLALIVLSFSTSSVAAIITVPLGLTPGSEYRLVFVTADTYTATSTNIGDYNSEVNTEADTIPGLDALGTTWLDIGSTGSVNAIDNIGLGGSGVGVPIYNLAGAEVAADDTGNTNGLFWNSNSPGLAALIDIDEDGATLNDHPFTGTNVDGTAYTGYGGLALGNSNVLVGDNSRADWDYWTDDITESKTSSQSLYAISGILVVPAAVPEPATSLMLTLGGALLLGMRRRMVQRKNRAAQTLG